MMTSGLQMMNFCIKNEEFVLTMVKFAGGAVYVDVLSSGTCLMLSGLYIHAGD